MFKLITVHHQSFLWYSCHDIFSWGILEKWYGKFMIMPFHMTISYCIHQGLIKPIWSIISHIYATVLISLKILNCGEKNLWNLRKLLLFHSPPHHNLLFNYMFIYFTMKNGKSPLSLRQGNPSPLICLLKPS
jgi:hypothetical protein